MAMHLTAVPEKTESISQTEFDTSQQPTVSAQKELPPEAPKSRRAGVYNILLCGTDADGLRTDTILLAYLDEKSGKTALFSLPRDIPILSRDGTLMKLNAVYAGDGADGMERLKSRVGEMLGFQPDGYVLIDMEAFRQIIDLLGGVDFEVAQDMDYIDPAQGLEIHLKAGFQHLNGEQTMQLVRYRKGYAMQDIERTKVQRELLYAIAKRCLSAEGFAKLPRLLYVLCTRVTTDLSLSNLLYFANVLRNCDLTKMESAALMGEGVTVDGISYYALYEGKLLETINRILCPYDSPLRKEDIRLITPERAADYCREKSKR